MHPTQIHSRRADPSSSTEFLQHQVSATRMTRLLNICLHLAQQSEHFTDTDLNFMVGERYGNSPGRNVIAKIRQQLEELGYIERLVDPTMKPILLHPVKGKGQKVLAFNITVKGLEYCRTHGMDGT